MAHSDIFQTSVTDQPVISKDEESLDVIDYSNAMIGFITGCSTPLTIGIQGEWGSGKTSMMNIISNELDELKLGTAWVNTWEYAMFRQAGEIVPSVMRGLLENFKSRSEEKGFWPKSLAKNMEKVTSFLQNVGRFAIDVGVEKAIGRRGFTDAVSGSSTNSAVRAEIADIKREIKEILNAVVQSDQNPYQKVVFFIDDLDRIEPSVAVGILEALKNIFDLPHCVFVLAIDYEVVVKGLESKFGPKTESNEREFRSFFDKIIQVPFSMPISAYNIDRLIQSRLDQLGFKVDRDRQEAFKNIVNYTVGANPRSIKRYINTFSLLSRISAMKRSEANQTSGVDDFALFSLIGIQIAYPRIYQLILKNPDFVGWTTSFARQIDVDISMPDEYKEHDLFDEVWEQIIWSFCQRDAYLRVRVNSVLNALNLIRKIAGDENLDGVIADGLVVANITSVDDDQESNQAKHKRVRLDGWDAYSRAQVERGIPNDVLSCLFKFHRQIEKIYLSRGLFIKYTPRDITFNANTDKRRKVFVYATPQKNCIRLWLASTGTAMKINGIEGAGSELWDEIDKSYQVIVSGQSERES